MLAKKITKQEHDLADYGLLLGPQRFDQSRVEVRAKCLSISGEAQKLRI